MRNADEAVDEVEVVSMIDPSVLIGAAALVAVLVLVFAIVRAARHKETPAPERLRPYVDLTGLRNELDKQLDIAAGQNEDADRSTSELVTLRDDLTQQIDERGLEGDRA